MLKLVSNLKFETNLIVCIIYTLILHNAKLSIREENRVTISGYVSTVCTGRYFHK